MTEDLANEVLDALTVVEARLRRLYDLMLKIALALGVDPDG